MLKLELTEQMLSVVANALSDAPFRIAAPVLAEIDRQVRQQQARPAPPPQTSAPPESNAA